MNRPDFIPAREDKSINEDPNSDVISMRAIFATLWRNAWIVALMTLLGLGCAYHYAYNVAIATYRATASIVLETSDRSFISFDETTGRLSSDVMTLNTQIGVLRGFDLLGRVVDELSLAEDPEFNVLAVQGEDGTTRASTLDPDVAAQLGRDLSVRALLVRLEVSNLPNSLIFEIAVSTSNAVKSMQIANTIADLYIAEQVERKVSETAKATGWLRNRVAELQIELQEAESRIDGFRFDSDTPNPESVAQLEQLTSETEAVRAVYRYLLTRLQETVAQQGLHRSDSRVLSSAMLPLGPSAPRHMLILAVGVVVGGFLGVVIVFLRASLDRKIRTGEQIEKLSGLPIIGELPEVSARLRKSSIPGLIGERALIYAEALENLLMTLLMSRVRNNPHVIVVMSAKPGEGKSTLSLSLAQRAAHRGHKTLLVDADMRKRRISRDFGYKGAGLRAVFDGSAPFEDAITSIDAINVDLLGCTKSKVQKTGRLDSGDVETFFEQARQRYDIIIVDTPPVRAVADALPFGKSADTALMLCRWNDTRSEDIVASMRILNKVHIEPAGYVMMQARGAGFSPGYFDGYLDQA